VSAIYVDSSALVKLIVIEAESDALRRYLEAAGPLASSILVTVEVARAVRRVAPDSEAAIAAAIDSVAIMALDDRIAARAAVLEPSTLRALDAIHLASALELGADLRAFVCYDDRLSAAARDLGLPVVSPDGNSLAT
jgi:predicted nucleic acid-binding protein